MNLIAEKPLAAVIISSLMSLAFAGPVYTAAPANPCAPKAGNPCAAKDPCAARNPHAVGTRIDARRIRRPTGYRPYQGDKTALVTAGERLFNDGELSTNTMSCDTCHQGGSTFQPSFAKPYPHWVAMAAERAGLKQIHLDEMVQLCLVAPMASKPLPWDSMELAALVAYVGEVQKGFKPRTGGMANPCAPRNPCAAKNPCAARNPGAAPRR